MNRLELKKYSLIETDETKEVSRLTGDPVYRIIGFENTLLSNYDFIRNITLPEGIWSVSKAYNHGIFQIHLNEDMLKEVEKSAIWAAKLLDLQIYLKQEFDD